MGLEWVWGLLQPGFVRWAPPASQNHFNHCACIDTGKRWNTTRVTVSYILYGICYVIVANNIKYLQDEHEQQVMTSRNKAPAGSDGNGRLRKVPLRIYSLTHSVRKGQQRRQLLYTIYDNGSTKFRPQLIGRNSVNRSAVGRGLAYVVLRLCMHRRSAHAALQTCHEHKNYEAGISLRVPLRFACSSRENEN